MEKVILVDEKDNEIGTEEKIKAHQNGGKLHRAFSIFIFNSQGQMLIHRRAAIKYHSPGLWTNACCSHPRPGESLKEAVHRRLKEEMGFDCELEESFSFIYKADVGNGLTEWEFDHVFTGRFDGEPEPNPKEVDDWKWMNIDELKKDIEQNPEKYTPWFRIAFERVVNHLKL
ncbi:MAG: isopentenyl-diphosphate delta-isomerase [Candidatus Aenigmatarchaeota archaeon]|nr:MAG: isopentenyl-diphosphate delta-isomerase [Candidatus Aenigmarchaeota archaeon]